MRPGRIAIATPIAATQTAGNQVTAQRYARLFEELGHAVTLLPVVAGEETPLVEADLLVALHARRSAAVLRRWCAGGGQAVLVLTGTDLYQDIGVDESVLESLSLAAHVVVLQPLGLARLPEDARARSRVIVQSSPLHPERDSRAGRSVVLASHLRAVKDPLLVVEALAAAPSLEVEVDHFGGELDEGMGLEAARHARGESRYTWHGERPFDEVSAALSSARLALSSSHLEGGANAVIEAIAHDVPLLTTGIEGALGILGTDYPGVFEVGDAAGLAAQLERFFGDPDFERELLTRCRSLRGLVRPERELEEWRALLADSLVH